MHTSQSCPADIRRSRHIGDFTKWKSHDDYQRPFERLLRDLQQSQGRSTELRSPPRQ